jgi:tetratricopeptide (TPR) repeat protein
MAAWAVARPARIALVAVAAALLGFQVLRAAAVADREAHAGLAAALWPSHPAVLTDRALLVIATAAAHSRPVPEATRDDIRRIAARAPLSPDPYLIEGAIAETEGDGQAAEALLLAARSRDPRSRGARFLLADRFLRSGRITAALIEMQALVSLQSRGVEVFEPTLAAFARSPGAVPQLKAFFARYPRVEASVLSILAGDAANADLVLALANVRDPNPDWRGTLVSALASAGQYAKAYATWSRLSGIRPQRGLFNSGFAKIAALPPFNWALPETSDGVAEPDGKGGVEVLFYGRARAILASQLLLLQPGNYRLAMNVAEVDGEAGALHWTLRCANVNKDLADIPLRSGMAVGGFAVPAGCEAQWLELQGLASDSPQTTELGIHDLRLIAEAGR